MRGRRNAWAARASMLPKTDEIRKHGEMCRGWKILHELLRGLVDYNRANRPTAKQKMLLIVREAAERSHYRRNVANTFLQIEHSRMSLMQVRQRKAARYVPSVAELVKRIRYTKSYLALKQAVGDQRIEHGLAKMKARGMELRNSMITAMGVTGQTTQVSRFARIEPHFRNAAEKEYLLHWIESKIPSDGIIDKLFRRCDAATKIAFVAGLKYRYYAAQTGMVYQNDAAHEFFILISGSVGVYVNGDLSDLTAEFATKGQRVAVLPTGFSFGEAALKGAGSTRQATIIAEETSEVLIASQALFDGIIKQFNASSKAMAIGLLSDIWPFKGQRHVVEKMSACFDLVSLTADVEICVQGRAAENVFVLVDGECKELLKVHKIQTNDHVADAAELRTRNPGLVREPHKHSVCSSSGIVIAVVNTKRLIGAHEVIKGVACQTSIVTVGACKVLKAQLHAFLHQLQSCPVLKTRIAEQARLQKVFVQERAKQFSMMAERGTPDLRSLAAGVFNNRAYVHHPRALLNRKVRRKGASGSRANERRQHAELGDLYQTQHIENVARDKSLTLEVNTGRGARVTLSTFIQEKLLLDLRSVADVKEQVEQYSARYKAKVLLKEMARRDGMRYKTKTKRKTSTISVDTDRPLYMNLNDRYLEHFSMKRVKEDQKRLSHRFQDSCKDTDKMSNLRADVRRTEFHQNIKYEAARGRPQSTREMSVHGVSVRKKRKVRRRHKDTTLDFYLRQCQDGKMMRIQSACLTPRGDNTDTDRCINIFLPQTPPAVNEPD